MAFKTKQVDLGCVVAIGLWIATLVCITGAMIIGYISDEVTPAVIGSASIGLATSAAAATATIRSYFVRMDRKVDQFFQLGADYGAGTVRKMR